MTGPVTKLVRAGGILAATVALGGCSSQVTKAQPERVQTAIQKLGGTPESIFAQQVLAKDNTTGAFTSRSIFIVPVDDGKAFRIVDSSGETYQSYDDFLRNNSWPG